MVAIFFLRGVLISHQQRYNISIAVYEYFWNFLKKIDEVNIHQIYFSACGHLRSWSFWSKSFSHVKIRHYIINILYLYIVSQMTHPKMKMTILTLTTLTTDFEKFCRFHRENLPYKTGWIDVAIPKMSFHRSKKSSKMHKKTGRMLPSFRKYSLKSLTFNRYLNNSSRYL